MSMKPAESPRSDQQKYMSQDTVHPPNTVPAVTVPAERATTGQRVNNRGHRLIWRFGTLGWFTIDCATAMFSVLLASLISPHPSALYAVPLVPLCVAYSVLLSTLAHISGLHDPRYPRRVIDLIGRIALVVSTALILLTLELLLVHFMKIGRYVLFLTAFLSITSMVTARLIVWYFSSNFAQTICFLGEDRFCFEAAQFLDEHPLPFNITTALEYHSQDKREALCDWAISRDVDEIVYDPNSELVNEQSLLQCLDQAIKISSYPDFVESNYCMVPVEDIDAKWLFSAQLELAHPYYNGLKRLVDILAALAGMVLISPVMLVVMAAIKLESRGPIFYSQTRVGRFNRPFRIHKLRTMVLDAEKDGAQWAQQQDARITRIGNLLRRTRLDESPQFWNIFTGEMSLVGPRPERPEFVEMLQEQIPFYVQRHLVKPGLTGWAQINYPYGSSIEDAKNKLKFDLFYVKHASLSLDTPIVLRTIGAVMKGAR